MNDPFFPHFETAIRDKIFSAAALAIGFRGTLVYQRTWGTTCFGKKGMPVAPDSLFDLASLTKPIATVTLFMDLVARRTVALGDPLTRFFPETWIPKDKKSIRLGDLLSHRSGLPAWRPYHLQLVSVPDRKRKETLMRWILEERLTAPRGKRKVYSDLGYLLLGWILEEITGKSLDALFSEKVAQRIHAPDLAFRRLDPFHRGPSSEDIHRFVATEKCPWRNRLLQGEVHDENAFCLNGVAGHAGLFGSAGDVWKWLKTLWEISLGKSSPLLDFPRKILLEFWTRRNSRENGWSFGFDHPAALHSSAGRFFSPSSVGHLGFTGTSFWLDPEAEIAVILLTNRVHPSRNDDRIRFFRPRIHDLAFQWVREGRLDQSRTVDDNPHGDAWTSRN